MLPMLPMLPILPNPPLPNPPPPNLPASLPPLSPPDPAPALPPADVSMEGGRGGLGFSRRSSPAARNRINTEQSCSIEPRSTEELARRRAAAPPPEAAASEEDADDLALLRRPFSSQKTLESHRESSSNVFCPCSCVPSSLLIVSGNAGTLPRSPACKPRKSATLVRIWRVGFFPWMSKRKRGCEETRHGETRHGESCRSESGAAHTTHTHHNTQEKRRHACLRVSFAPATQGDTTDTPRTHAHTTQEVRTPTHTPDAPTTPRPRLHDSIDTRSLYLLAVRRDRDPAWLHREDLLEGTDRVAHLGGGEHCGGGEVKRVRSCACVWPRL